VNFQDDRAQSGQGLALCTELAKPSTWFPALPALASGQRCGQAEPGGCHRERNQIGSAGYYRLPEFESGMVSGWSSASTTKTARRLAGSVSLAFSLTP
jgi:hypothetical protein